MEQSALFADVVTPSAIIPPPKNRHNVRGKTGRFQTSIGNGGSEVATAERGEFLSPLLLFQYPNFSDIIGRRDRGQGVRFYQTMLGADADLSGFYRDLEDDVLHYPLTVTAAAPGANYQLHRDFVADALDMIPDRQNAIRHALGAYARGFAVLEKVYRVVQTGKWAGAVVFDRLLDKPQRWFSFDLERRLRFRTVQNLFPGELVDQGKFAVVTFGTSSNPWGEPTLDDLYWPWYLKHAALKWQAIFMEKWSSPTPKVKYNRSSNPKVNDKNKAEAIAIAMAIQQDSAVAFPEGMDLSLLESMRSGTVSFGEYIAQLTETESRLVTGQLLTSMGAQGGSHALGKIHEKRAANKVEMLARWLSTTLLADLARELVDRNFGPQDAYPRAQILAKDAVSMQADATLLQQHLANGLDASKAHYMDYFGVVAPSGAGDKLVPSAVAKPGQVLPVSPQLSAGTPARAGLIDLASPGALRQDMQPKAVATRAHLDQIGSDAVKKARPAITKAVKSIGAALKKKARKGVSKLTRADAYGALQGAAGVPQIGDALHTMLDKPSRMQFADPPTDQPPDISTEALLALALQMLAIVEAVYSSADGAPEGTDSQTFVDGLTDPNGAKVDANASAMFENVHGTNIASVATANLRRQLADPKFRAKYPYVMIVATNPNVRLTHRVLDGFILSAEDARYSPFLPPFDFGCDCIAVPISAEEAAARGLTGNAPTGTLDQFLQAHGATPDPYSGYRTPDGQRFQPGGPVDFRPAYPGTDYQVQLTALRQKAEELRAQDPEAWLELQKWLKWLFSGLDVLRVDPPV